MTKLFEDQVSANYAGDTDASVCQHVIGQEPVACVHPKEIRPLCGREPNGTNDVFSSVSRLLQKEHHEIALVELVAGTVYQCA